MKITGKGFQGHRHPAAALSSPEIDLVVGPVHLRPCPVLPFRAAPRSANSDSDDTASHEGEHHQEDLADSPRRFCNAALDAGVRLRDVTIAARQTDALRLAGQDLDRPLRSFPHS